MSSGWLWAMEAAAEVDRSGWVDGGSERARDPTECTAPGLAASQQVGRRKVELFLGGKKTIMLLQPNQYVLCCLSPGAKRMTAFMHPTSLESGDNCRNRHKISWTVFISTHVAGSSGILSRTCGLSNSVAKSHGTLHCAKFSKNSSFHDSCSSNCWSGFDRVWNGTRHRTHLTAMNKRRAVVSYLD